MASGLMLVGMVCPLARRLLVSWFVGLGAGAAGAGSGFDTGQGVNTTAERWGATSPAAIAGLARGARGDDFAGHWLRIRGMAHAPTVGASGAARPEDAAKLEALRAGFLRVRELGGRTVCMLRWGNKDWAAVRPGGGQRAPLDLREAYARGLALAESYGDVVDAWEIENEPDLDFFVDNADVYMAFHKAVYWGLKAGDADAVVVMPAPGLPPGPHFEQLLANGLLAHTDAINFHHYGFTRDYAGGYRQFRDAVERAEGMTTKRTEGTKRLWARGGRAKGEGRLAMGGRFDRVTENLSRRPEGIQVSAFSSHPPASAATRRLPVMLTEWGYSLLDGYAAQTAEGRVRQWRHFKTISEWNARHGVAAPMAFVAYPYYEYAAKEFGLPMPAADARMAHYGFVVEAGEGGVSGGEASATVAAAARASIVPCPLPIASQPPAHRPSPLAFRPPTAPRPSPLALSAPAFPAGGVGFSPADFGRARPTAWMARIGEPMWQGEASPALAWLLSHDGVARPGLRNPRKASEAGGRSIPTDGRWTVRAEAPSPVVLELLAGADALAVKSYNGYWLRGQVEVTEDGSRRATAMGVLRVYNFGAERARVRLVLDGALRLLAATGGADEFFELEPGARREFAVRLSADADAFAPTPARAWAEVREGSGAEGGGLSTVSRWALSFYPWPQPMVQAGRRDLLALDAEGGGAARVATQNRAFLLGRPLAPEEPPVRGAPGTAWLTTEGVAVERTATGWRFRIEHLPRVGLRPAVMELPLPDGWRLSAGETLSYAYRMEYPEGAMELAAGDPDPRRRAQAGKFGAQAESYVRTANGNLYSTVPRLAPGAEWKRYQQNVETLTMHFLGRAELPWRLAENRPTGWVFFVRPAKLPAIFEVSEAALVRWVGR